MNKNNRYCGKLHEFSMITVIFRGRWLLGAKRVLGSFSLFCPATEFIIMIEAARKNAKNGVFTLIHDLIFQRISPQIRTVNAMMVWCIYSFGMWDFKNFAIVYREVIRDKGTPSLKGFKDIYVHCLRGNRLIRYLVIALWIPGEEKSISSIIENAVFKEFIRIT